jgi:hypothetical protein
MTKKELLARATELGIVGRHDMNVVQLQDAITAITKIEDEVGGDQAVIEAREALIELKRRTPSTNERDETGRVVRRGRNLSMNTPFRPKFYYLDPAYADESTWSDGYRESVNAAPNQVKLILKFMRTYRIFDAETAEQGVTIVSLAIQAGLISTKIPPANLFAYYRRILEALGVRNAHA